MKDQHLSDDEIRANHCLEQYDVKIVHTDEGFSLVGDVRRVQDAYLDDACRSNISLEVRRDISAFFEHVDRLVVDCLVAKGYAVSIDPVRGGFDGARAPADAVTDCFAKVYAKFSGHL
jgi:hypothetical protein